MADPTAALVTENDIAKKKQEKVVPSTKQKENWVSKMIEKEFQVTPSSITQLFLDCLKEYCLLFRVKD